MNQRTPLTVHQQSSVSTKDVFHPQPTQPNNPVNHHAQPTNQHTYRNNPKPNFVQHIYIHVPFCFHKCHYCDFYSFVDNRDRQLPFTQALIKQLNAQAPFAGQIKTIFVGGGTPSLLKPALWSTLLKALSDTLDLSNLQEFTVECNPETVTDELVHLYAQGIGEAKVNRVSVGAQTFNPAHLKALERWHDPDNVANALHLAKQAGIPHRSLDLIYAIPGQTLDQVKQDLDTALKLPIDHISAYALTYEPNTAMTKRMERGQFEPTPDDLEADMFDLVHHHLRSNQFQRYEVSNFARAPETQSMHNLAYWRQSDWLALGPSASGHYLGSRWKNVPRLTDWMQAVNNNQGHCPVVDLEKPDPKRALAERIMTALRLTEGIPQRSIYQAAEDLNLKQAIDSAISQHQQAGWLQHTTTALRCTEQGLKHADGIAADIITAIL